MFFIPDKAIYSITDTTLLAKLKAKLPFLVAEGLFLQLLAMCATAGDLAIASYITGSVLMLNVSFMVAKHAFQQSKIVALQLVQIIEVSASYLVCAVNNKVSQAVALTGQLLGKLKQEAKSEMVHLHESMDALCECGGDCRC